MEIASFQHHIRHWYRSNGRSAPPGVLAELTREGLIEIRNRRIAVPA